MSVEWICAYSLAFVLSLLDLLRMLTLNHSPSLYFFNPSGDVHCQSQTLLGRSNRPARQGQTQVGHGVPRPARICGCLHESAADGLRGTPGRSICRQTGGSFDPVQQCAVRRGGARGRTAKEAAAAKDGNGGLRMANGCCMLVFANDNVMVIRIMEGG